MQQFQNATALERTLHFETRQTPQEQNAPWRVPQFHVVSHHIKELLNKNVANRKLQATIHEYAKGVKSPLATHFSLRPQNMRKRRVSLTILALVIFLAALFWFSPFWDARIVTDEIGVYFVPRVERSVSASELVLKRVVEARSLEGAEFRERILAAQRMLTVVESNLAVPDKPFKTLRRLQETEDALRKAHIEAEAIQARSDKEELIVKHAMLRIDILIQEIDLEKQKSKAQLG